RHHVRINRLEQIGKPGERESRLSLTHTSASDRKPLRPRKVDPRLPQRALTDPRFSGQHERPRRHVRHQETLYLAKLRPATYRDTRFHRPTPLSEGPTILVLRPVKSRSASGMA